MCVCVCVCVCVFDVTETTVFLSFDRDITQQTALVLIKQSKMAFVFVVVLRSHCRREICCSPKIAHLPLIDGITLGRITLAVELY